MQARIYSVPVLVCLLEAGGMRASKLYRSRCIRCGKTIHEKEFQFCTPVCERLYWENMAQAECAEKCVKLAIAPTEIQVSAPNFTVFRVTGTDRIYHRYSNNYTQAIKDVTADVSKGLEPSSRAA